MAADEEKKGNIMLSGKIRKAYVNKKKSKGSVTDFSQSTSSFSLQSAMPRDKDSLLELFEVINSDTSLKDVILPESQKKIIDQVIDEQRNAEKLLKHNMAPVNRMLLCGPPGTGKTMTAYAIGHEPGITYCLCKIRWTCVILLRTD